MRKGFAKPGFGLLVAGAIIGGAGAWAAGSDLVEQNERVRLLGQDRNLGFAAANNLAARQASGEYLVVLNADTMVTSGWIERLLRHLRKDWTRPFTYMFGNASNDELIQAYAIAIRP